MSTKNSGMDRRARQSLTDTVCLWSLSLRTTEMIPWYASDRIAFWNDEMLIKLKNWSFPAKLAVLLQISVLALIGNMSAAVINPAFVPLGKAFSITTVEASYELTVYVR